MFERFTSAARAIVQCAVYEAEQEPAREITAEHLAIALLEAEGYPESVATRIFDEYELPRAEVAAAIRATRRRAGLSDAETAALRELGIDIDAVVERVEQTLGEGALASAGRPSKRRGLFRDKPHRPFTHEAKRVLEGSLREALDRGDKHIGDEHILLSVLSRTRVAAEVLAARGVTYTDARARIAKAS